MPDRALFVGGPLDGQMIVVDHWPMLAQKRGAMFPINQGGLPVGMDVAVERVFYYPHHWRGVLWGVSEDLYAHARKHGFVPLERLRSAALRLLFEAVRQERIDPPDNDDQINAAMDIAETVLDAVKPEQERELMDITRWMR